MNKKIICSSEFCERNVWRPIEGESSYCIFHSPKIDEKIDEFNRCWDKFLLDHTDNNKNIIELDCEGFIFPINIRFSNKILSGFTNFTYAKFCKNANFSGSTIKDGIDFSHAQFFGYTSFIVKSCSCSVDFSNTTFSHKSSLFEVMGLFDNANFIGTNLTNSTFTNCTFANVKYNIKPIKWEKPEKWWQFWKYRKLETPIQPTDFTGIETKGILAASNRQFVRDIEDQQFLNQFKERHNGLYKLWLWSCDCGRSFFRWFIVCALFVIAFGLLYWFKRESWFENSGNWKFFTSFYYSVVTFSTLGFGDIHPTVGKVWGEFWVMLEVILSYIGLGGLISIFANKLARRA